MPEIYGLPEPEPTKAEQAKAAINEVIAGQGITRRVVLYAALALFTVINLGADGVVGLTFGALAVVALVLLMATDRGLE